MKIAELEKEGLIVENVSEPITLGNVTSCDVKLYSPSDGDEFTRKLTCHSTSNQLDELYSEFKNK